MILDQDAYLGFRFDPGPGACDLWSGHVQEATNRFLSHTDVSLSHPLSLKAMKKKSSGENKINLSP